MAVEVHAQCSIAVGALLSLPTPFLVMDPSGLPPDSCFFSCGQDEPKMSCAGGAGSAGIQIQCEPLSMRASSRRVHCKFWQALDHVLESLQATVPVTVEGNLVQVHAFVPKACRRGEGSFGGMTMLPGKVYMWNDFCFKSPAE